MNAPAAGRNCPLGYRYDPRVVRHAPEQTSDTLYVIGGLYGNLPALEAILEMARCERHAPTLCFNGDFNWFNVDDAGFVAVNQAVLAHDAILGNVEAELFAAGDDAGCGCAYPDQVDAGVVERSNRIHARLKRTARKHPALLERLARLPLVRRYRVGGCAVGIVHGDAESLSGWRFDVAALDDPANLPWLGRAFRQAHVDVFASSHTCLPALRRFAGEEGSRIVINNGAAGMPNFAAVRAGLITRIATQPGVHVPSYGVERDGIHIDAVPVPYTVDAWERVFLGNWPAGTAAHSSYFSRISKGPEFSVESAASFDGL